MPKEIQAVTSAEFDAALDNAIMSALKGTPLVKDDGTPAIDWDGHPIVIPPDAAVLTVAEKRAKAKRGTSGDDAADALAEAQAQHELAMEARGEGNPEAPPQSNGDENIR